ncbi:unnamed protein product [Caenorhabditis sp. 36 PRJEB53466]|nr:unnamed protein product [Caenorhabditis sp. 36 PRJEB53466]
MLEVLRYFKQLQTESKIEVQSRIIADRKQNSKESLLIGKFDSDNRTWTLIGRMPNQIANYGVASGEKHVYIVGGMSNGIWLSTVEVYDDERGLREELPSMKQARTRTAAVLHNGTLFVIGGYNGTYMNSVEIYDVKKKTWRNGPLLQRRRADCGVVFLNEKLYVIGGFNGSTYEAAIEKYDASADRFEIVGKMEEGRAGFGICSFNNCIYVAGGWSSASNTLASVRSYDPITRTWRDEPRMSTARKYFEMYSTETAIYAIRGCADNWNRIENCERLLSNNQWETIELAP